MKRRLDKHIILTGHKVIDVINPPSSWGRSDFKKSFVGVWAAPYKDKKGNYKF